MTMILMAVILGVSQRDRDEGLLAGVAVGSTIALEAIFGGPVSGASMNPARSFGPALVTQNFLHHWIYWVAPVLGSVLGVALNNMLRSYKNPKP